MNFSTWGAAQARPIIGAASAAAAPTRNRRRFMAATAFPPCMRPSYRPQHVPPGGQGDERERDADAPHQCNQRRIEIVLDRDDGAADLRPHGGFEERDLNGLPARMQTS